MTTHTPGPWVLGNADNCGRGYAVCAGPYVIARVVGNGYPIGMGRSPKSDANARLIAAAPDMLAALKDVLAWIDGQRRIKAFRNRDGTPYDIDFPAARAAIRQAEREKP